MGSPFPGMDPYLEGDMWQEFHERLANQISVQLMPSLTPKYVALLARRYVMGRPDIGISELPAARSIYPDVGIIKTPIGETAAPYATSVAAPAVEVLSLVSEQVPVTWIEIRDIAERTLVTVIEILSPVNKYGEGQREYLDRREELLRTRTHLLEIDLIRRGQRIPFADPLPPAPYYVFLSRGWRRPYTQVWPLGLREPLQVVPVPLLPPDPDVPLDLQRAVDACFALVGYERLLGYQSPPPPPELDAADRQWLEARLREAGRRGT